MIAASPAIDPGHVGATSYPIDRFLYNVYSNGSNAEHPGGHGGHAELRQRGRLPVQAADGDRCGRGHAAVLDDDG